MLSNEFNYNVEIVYFIFLHFDICAYTNHDFISYFSYFLLFTNNINIINRLLLKTLNK